jgi:nucleotide-binding universal stress UspA family protein
MAERILVPVDGSELSARAVPWADQLAGALHAEVELLHVLPLDPHLESLEAEVELNRRFMPTRPEEAAIERRFSEELEAATNAAREALEPMRATLRQAIGVETAVQRGDPEEMIVAHAAQKNARLIVMATHAREGLARTILGSVAGAVLQRSGVPVLLINPRLQATPHVPRRILVPLDGSPLADAVLRAVVPLAQQLRCGLVMFTVAALPPPTVPVQGASIPLGLPLAHAPAEVEEHLERAAQDARNAGLAAEVAIGFGDRSETIAHSAVERGCDLIAMSTHGRHGVGRWLVGSVTDAVVRTADVPVLAICPPEVREATATGR